MSEYLISSNKTYTGFFQLLIKSLKNFKSSLKLNITIKKLCGRFYASVVCPENNYSDIKILIKDMLRDIILINYKYVFFKKSLNIKISDKALESLFYTSITLYDREYDYELLNLNFAAEKELTVDGIFNFCLSELKKRWVTVAQILQDNFYSDNDRDAICEFIKHIIYSLPNKLNEVNIYKKEDLYVFLDGNGKSIDEFISANGGELASKIIFVNPALINFYDCNDRQTMTFLKNIFNERIKFFS